MISFDEALRLVSHNLPLNKTENVQLNDALNRVLSADIKSDMDMPPFDKAAVDGFACRRADLDKPLKLIEVVPAGVQPAKTVTQNCCSKIMTGAPIPKGADCVVMVEQTSMPDENTVVVTDTKTKNNIAYKAEDIKMGAVVVPKGTLLAPQHMAVLASVGAVDVPVYQKVRLTVMSTGDELVEPHIVPGPSQIRNSNGIQLLMQALRMGVDARYGGNIADNEDACRQMIGEAIAESQVLVLSGGISMGDYDYVPAILKELGFELLFKSIAVQPGKPTVFARSKNKFVFALPGNPVSSFNIFELLAKPFLFKLMGHEYSPPVLKLPMGADYERRSTGRMGFVPAKINNAGCIEPISYHGSAHINAFVVANALFSMPPGIEKVNKGEKVDVRLI